ncbi:MAG: phenylacetic acid degradation protein PaaN [Beijerinckiaceae bacterium]
MSPFLEKHKALLDRALLAIDERTYWSAYPENPSPKVYGETAKDEQEAAFKALLGKPFELVGHPADGPALGGEVSPFGPKLGVSYPTAKVATLISSSMDSSEGWEDATPDDRAGVLLEIIERLNKQSFLIANAVSMTSGQAFMMAFQAGGPHAQDRALEAVAYALAEQRRVPKPVQWEKPQGKGDPIRLDKQWKIVPRGVALIIGCATFPTWNTYPGMFASLATGNSVIIKPHPAAILPAAISVRIAREVLAEAGFDPNLVLLAADTAEKPVTKKLIERQEVEIVDYTGSSQFGQWLRETQPHKQIYSEEAGVNAIAITGTSNFKGMCDNIAFSLSLYSGQMCTAPQNIFVPKKGIETDEGPKSFDDVGAGIASAIDRLLADPARAKGVLGAIQNPATLKRITAARKLGKIVRDSTTVEDAAEARMATPLLVSVNMKDEHIYCEERFGPIAFIVACPDAHEAVLQASMTVFTYGAITAALYATDDAMIAFAQKAFGRAGANLSVNLVGNIFVNQSAAFSDFHATGANPASNATISDPAFIAGRFKVIATRRLL